MISGNNIDDITKLQKLHHKMIDWITELDRILELVDLTSECHQEFVDLKTTLCHGSVHLIPTLSHHKFVDFINVSTIVSPGTG